MSRITVTLSASEKDALLRFAARELRNPRDQATLLLRRALESAGYLKSEPGAATEVTRDVVHKAMNCATT